MKKARIVYNPGEDSFEVQINTGDGWGLDTGFFCVAKTGETETNYVHFRILNKLGELQQQGYKIEFC